MLRRIVVAPNASPASASVPTLSHFLALSASPDFLKAKCTAHTITATTAMSGRYIRCSNTGCSNGITDDVGANATKNHAPRNPTALFRTSNHAVTISKTAITPHWIHNSTPVGGCGRLYNRHKRSGHTLRRK